MRLLSFLSFLETQESRQTRLDANRAAQQLRMEGETHEARQARLETVRVARQLRMEGETPEARQARLETVRAARQLRMEGETPEARQARLETVRAARQLRMEGETPEARQTRLETVRAARQLRIEGETPEARQTRLQQDRERHRQQREVNPDVPLFEQPAVSSKMRNFHTKLVSLEFYKCSSCLEHFPDMAMSTNRTECARCGRDKHIPKLYSAANNMSPGPVPPQLQVHVCVHCMCTIGIVLYLEAM